ncbi:tyrosine-protein phosphatase [Lacticaseibacillus paracasei]|uniref:tyrosine-protein phosphatase n=1 Tax=Lacticaseibacillus paracasei TaxID=1597 RepID=UPI00194EC949|nr:tyrosine-protein phosphatase [Lacticaseibacillus paracasei]MBM6413710.1 tyrosine-protein phosphatase [Lacticaseibacillus paracasei]
MRQRRHYEMYKSPRPLMTCIIAISSFAIMGPLTNETTVRADAITVKNTILPSSNESSENNAASLSESHKTMTATDLSGKNASSENSEKFANNNQAQAMPDINTVPKDYNPTDTSTDSNFDSHKTINVTDSSDQKANSESSKGLANNEKTQSIIGVNSEPQDSIPATKPMSSNNDNSDLDMNTSDQSISQLANQRSSTYLSDDMDSTWNTRDLGGYTTADGSGTIKYDKLIRSDRLSDLTDGDLKYLQSKNIQEVIDFRTPKQIKKNTDRQIPGAIEKYYSVLGQKSNSDGRGDEGMYDQKMSFSQPAIESYRSFFQDLLTNKGAILFHCTSGKDRTGIATVLILTALGVSKQTIYQDYLLSNYYYQESFNETDNVVEKSWLDEYYQQVEKKDGNLLAYIKDVLGVTDNQISHLKDMYLDPVPALGVDVRALNQDGKNITPVGGIKVNYPNGKYIGRTYQTGPVKIPGYTYTATTQDSSSNSGILTSFPSVIKYQYSVNKETANVIYIDDVTGKTLSTKNLSGKYGTTDLYRTGNTIAGYEEKGYKLVSDDYPSEGLEYNEDGSVQIFEVHLKHSTTQANETKPITRTIHYFYKNGTSACPDYRDEPVIFTRNVITDNVTGIKTYGTWMPLSGSSFSTIPMPVICGYTPRQGDVSQIGENSNNIVETVLYERNLASSAFNTVWWDEATTSNVSQQANGSKFDATSLKHGQLAKGPIRSLNNDKTLPQTSEWTNSDEGFYGTILIVLSGILGFLRLRYKRMNN